eukprot:10154186-Lingulodinium_polyedra.AAC.1
MALARRDVASVHAERKRRAILIDSGIDERARVPDRFWALPFQHAGRHRGEPPLRHPRGADGRLGHA